MIRWTVKYIVPVDFCIKFSGCSDAAYDVRLYVRHFECCSAPHARISIKHQLDAHHDCHESNGSLHLPCQTLYLADLRRVFPDLNVLAFRKAEPHSPPLPTMTHWVQQRSRLTWRHRCAICHWCTIWAWGRQDWLVKQRRKWVVWRGTSSSVWRWGNRALSWALCGRKLSISIGILPRRNLPSA